MDSGLDYIVENKDYVAKLGTALESEDQTVKKQVFDLMTALCAHSTEGYKRAFETLEHYMVRIRMYACINVYYIYTLCHENCHIILLVCILFE